RSQPRFDVVEFRRSHRVLRSGRQNLLDLVLGRSDAIRRLRMRGKSLRQRSRLLLFHGLKFFEKSDERLWVISRLVHILQAEVVRLRLKPTLEAQESYRQSQTSRLVRSVSNSPADENKWNGREVGILRPGQLPGRVAGADVRNFVRHHPSEFCFS